MCRVIDGRCAYVRRKAGAIRKFRSHVKNRAFMVCVKFYHFSFRQFINFLWVRVRVRMGFSVNGGVLCEYFAEFGID